MKVLAVSHAHPPHYYHQQEIIDAIREHWKPSERDMMKVERLHQATQVEGRYLSIPIEEFLNIDSFGASNDVFIKVGLEIAEQAILQSLTKADVSANEIDAIFVSSVTGIAVPTIDARLIEKMGFRRDIKRFPMFGLGCVAGAAGTARVNDYLRGHPDQRALLVCLELCSLTFQRNDFDVPNLIGTGLFADGCAAMIAVGDNYTAEYLGPKIIDSVSQIYPNSERIMGWDIGDHGFKIVLSSGVPDIVCQYLPDQVETFLQHHKLVRNDINSWVCHPGGPKVIDAIIESLNLEEYDLALTRQSLREVGNLSSASVLCVLEDTMYQRRPDPGSKGLMLAMGPGFVSELVLLQW